MKKLIKTYTTDIPVDWTIAEIQKILAHNGARGIALEYDDSGHIKDIFFKIMLNHKELPFRLPAKAGKVYTALHEGAPHHYHTRYGPALSTWVSMLPRPDYMRSCRETVEKSRRRK